MNKKQTHISEKWKSIIKILAILLIALFLLVRLKGIPILAILALVSVGLSFLINKFPIRQLGIELVTFIAVLTGFAYGPIPGFAIAFILIACHLFMGGFIDTYVLWVIPAYCLAGFAAGLMRGNPSIITQIGILITFAINASNSIFTFAFNPGNLVRYIPYAVTNIIFNVFIFTFFAPLMLVLIH